MSTFDSITALDRNDDYLSESEVSKEIETYELEKEKFILSKKLLTIICSNVIRLKNFGTKKLR